MKTAALSDTKAACPSTQITLIARIQKTHDHDAWQRFVQLYSPLILRFCRRRGLQHADADDVLQTVLTSVSRWIHSFQYDASKGRFRNWLGVVTCREIHRHNTRAARQGIAGCGGGAQDVVLASTPGEVDSTWTDEFNAHIYCCAMERVRERVSAETWHVFAAIWIQGQPAPDVAQRLGKPLSWIYKAKFRTLKQLRCEVEYLGSDAPLLLQ